MKKWFRRLFAPEDPPGPPIPPPDMTPPPETEIEIVYGALPELEDQTGPIPEVLDDRPITARIVIIEPPRKR